MFHAENELNILLTIWNTSFSNVLWKFLSCPICSISSSSTAPGDQTIQIRHRCMHLNQTSSLCSTLPAFVNNTFKSKIGQSQRKDTVRWVLFGVFSTSHFAPTALSSDWMLLFKCGYNLEGTFWNHTSYSWDYSVTGAIHTNE